MQKIIYSRPDGGVSVVHPVRNIVGDEHLTDDQILQRAWDKLQRDIDPLLYYKGVVRKKLGDMVLSDDELNLVTKNYINERNIKPLVVINPQVVDLDIIPADRTFRNAWEYGGDKVAVNMDKAREIHLNRIRKVRNAQLAALDVETMKAAGSADTKALTEVEAQKQTLRDIPQTIDLSKAKTPEELAAIWPKELQ